MLLVFGKWKGGVGKNERKKGEGKREGKKREVRVVNPWLSRCFSFKSMVIVVDSCPDFSSGEGVFV